MTPERHTNTIHHSDTIANIERLEPAIADVPCDNILGVVVYDLPGRDCAAKASNGELAVGELDRYKTEYIDGAWLSPSPAYMRYGSTNMVSSNRDDPQGES